MEQYKGQVRRVDELGRVVIPKEIRFTLKINAGNMLEFFCDSNAKTLTLCKYEPIKAIKDFAHSCFAALQEYKEYGFLLCDSTQVLFTQNLSPKEYVHSTMHYALFEKLKDNRVVQNATLFNKGDMQLKNVVLPINVDGDIWGCIVILGDNVPAYVISATRMICTIISNYIKQ